MRNTNLPGETLTMTRALLEDFKRYAARDEKAKIINIIRNDKRLKTMGAVDYIISLLDEDDV